MRLRQIEQRDIARTLRHQQTEAERKLWMFLRSRKLAGFKFYRQHPLDGYIVDFYCKEKRLIIELDGNQHHDQKEYDAVRTRQLQSRGRRVIRFWNNDILKQMQSTLDLILKNL